MSRYLDAVCKLCPAGRRKTFSERTALQRPRNVLLNAGAIHPENMGQTPPRRGRDNFRRQLRAKQKVKRTYGVFEKQFRNYYFKAARQSGIAG